MTPAPAHKKEEAERHRRYYAAHKKEEAERQRRYRAAHRKEEAEKRRRYRAAHKKEIAEYHHHYYAAHRKDGGTHLHAKAQTKSDCEAIMKKCEELLGNLDEARLKGKPEPLQEKLRT